MVGLESLYIFGDSIMKGVMLDPSNKRYVIQKGPGAEAFSHTTGLIVTNDSKFGCTITRGRERIEKALAQGKRFDAVLLEYGGNDCDFDWKKVSADPDGEHQPKTPLDQFIAEYKKIINLLRSHLVTPIIMTLPPIDAHKYLNWLAMNGLSRENILNWLGDEQMIYRFQELYSQTAASIARETGVLIADVRTAFLSRRDFNDLICDDGIHPTEKGHAIIYNALADAAAAAGITRPQLNNAG